MKKRYIELYDLNRDLINEYKYCFRNKRSTSMALINAIDE